MPYSGVVDDPRSKRGMVSMGLALGALVISLVLSWLCARGYVDILEATDLDSVQNGNIPPGLEGAAVKMTLGMLGQIVPTGMGIAAFIMALTSMKYPSQKGKAIIGLIVSIVAPIVSFIFWIVLLTPVIDKMS